MVGTATSQKARYLYWFGGRTARSSSTAAAMRTGARSESRAASNSRRALLPAVSAIADAAAAITSGCSPGARNTFSASARSPESRVRAIAWSAAIRFCAFSSRNMSAVACTGGDACGSGMEVRGARWAAASGAIIAARNSAALGRFLATRQSSRPREFAAPPPYGSRHICE